MTTATIWLITVLAQQPTPATIALKDGKSAQGQILGNLAMKSAEVEVSKDTAKHNVVFYLISPGDAVEAISSAGVSLRPNREVTLLLISWEPTEKAPTDLEALAAGLELQMNPNSFSFTYLPSGALVTRVKVQLTKPLSVDDLFTEIPKTTRGSSPALLAAPNLLQLLGTLHAEQGKPSLRGLQLNTVDGPRELPVASIVVFKRA